MIANSFIWLNEILILAGLTLPVLCRVVAFADSKSDVT